MKKLGIVVALALALSVSVTLAAPTPPPQAKGVLNNAAGEAIGNVLFTQGMDGTVYVSVAVKGLPQGSHGVTLRPTGVCSGDFGTAGPVLATDIPPIVVSAPIAELTASTRAISVVGGAQPLIDADGSAVVITANGDENAKVACAVLAGVPVPAPAAEATGASRATAEFKTVAGESVGTATMTQNADGSVRVQVQVRGLPPGAHGIHVHQFGQCAPTFGAAGEHHNPTNANHGVNNPMPPKPHNGDLPNITINADGTGTLDATTALFTLTPSDTTVLDSDGSAVIIHANPDDETTNPGGRSGLRIACAVVQVAAATAPSAAPTAAPSAAPSVAPTAAAPAPTVAPSAPAGGVPASLPNTGAGESTWLLLGGAALLVLLAGLFVRRTARR